MELKELKGAVIRKILQSKDGDELIFVSNDQEYVFFHEQDCCENVYIEDVCGDFNDLLDVPLLMAEVECNYGESCDDESCTWTFYKFSTIKGSVTVRWLGESNGYYSEEVDFTIRKRTIK
jgi:hypothetical protein